MISAASLGLWGNCESLSFWSYLSEDQREDIPCTDLFPLPCMKTVLTALSQQLLSVFIPEPDQGPKHSSCVCYVAYVANLLPILDNDRFIEGCASEIVMLSILLSSHILLSHPPMCHHDLFSLLSLLFSVVNG